MLFLKMWHAFLNMTSLSELCAYHIGVHVTDLKQFREPLLATVPPHPTSTNHQLCPYIQYPPTGLLHIVFQMNKLKKMAILHVT